MKQANYCFGVIEFDSSQKFVSIEDGTLGKVYAVPFRDIACVVSDYKENSFDMEVKEDVARKLVSHQKVIEKVMNGYSIIPIKFGTLIEDREGVRKFLEIGYTEFKRSLRNLNKNIELDVAALWNDWNEVVKSVVAEEESIRNLKEEIEKKPHKENLSDRIRIGNMIKTALDKKKEELQKEMLEFIFSQVKVEKTKKHDVLKDEMIFNCAFLIEKNREDEFDRALEELNRRCDESVQFRCVGPLPLYSFATYEVKKVSGGEINAARKLLGLDAEFNASAIKSAYRELVPRMHPDRFSGAVDAQKKFEEIQTAYKLLLKCCGNKRISFNGEETGSTYMVSLFNTI